MVPAAGVFRAEDLVGELGATGAEREVLVYLAERGEGTRYGAKKETGISYSIVHGAFKSLCERGWIRKVRDERSSHNVLRSVYRPTATGLLCAFLLKPESPSIFRRAERLFPLPLRFPIALRSAPARRFLGRSVSLGIFRILKSGVRPTGEEIRNSVEGAVGDLIRNGRGARELLRIAGEAAGDRGWGPLLLSAAEGGHRWFLERAEAMGRALALFEAPRGPLRTSSRA
jgi:DNA-binding MarR family transcriptional regulator